MTKPKAPKQLDAVTDIVLASHQPELADEPTEAIAQASDDTDVAEAKQRILDSANTTFCTADEFESLVDALIAAVRAESGNKI